MNRRHIWQKQIVPMLDWIKYECGPRLQSAAPWHDEAHALPVTYEKLTEKSDGLDFTTDGQASVRGILYDRRQDIQAKFGLYFDDYPGGLRFTLLPKLGMLWRYEEEQKRTQNALHKTAEMTVEAISASGKQIERALFEAMDRQYKAVVDGATRLRQMTQVLFARPQALKALPPARRRKKQP
jgi:hypothetical protein